MQFFKAVAVVSVFLISIIFGTLGGCMVGEAFRAPVDDGLIFDMGRGGKVRTLLGLILGLAAGIFLARLIRGK